LIIRAEPLTRAAFRPFGEVLETEGVAQAINEGRTLNFADLARVDAGRGGRVRLSIYRSSPVELPFPIRRMERHPLGSQAFYPLHDRPFPVIVALPGARLRPPDLRAFMTNGRQGVNLGPGVWHHYQLSLEQASEYLVIDRAGPGPNLEEREVTGSAVLQA
jgi:ureidoglycolate lyase